MRTGITDVIGGPYDFLPPRSDEFQKLLIEMKLLNKTVSLSKETENLSSRYVFSCVICFRFIHFILISTVHALFLTCLPVSIYGT